MPNTGNNENNQQQELNFSAENNIVRKRRSDTISREEVELGDIWEFLHEMNLKLELHLAEYKRQQPDVKELIEGLNKIKGAKWAVVILASIVGSFLAAKQNIIAAINNFLGR